MAETRISDIIDHLVTVWSTDATLAAAEVKVLDGPPTTDLAEPIVLAVGWTGTGEDDVDAAESAQTWAYVGRATSPTRDEELVVQCWLSVHRGGTDMKERRTELNTIFAAVAGALRATQAAWSAGGIVRYLELGGLRLRQLQADRGAVAEYVFSVRARAHI